MALVCASLSTERLIQFRWLPALLGKPSSTVLHDLVVGTSALLGPKLCLLRRVTDTSAGGLMVILVP